MGTQSKQGDLHIELGKTYRDKITGFTGVATACVHRLGGQIELILEGKDSDDRNRAEGYKFDWFRLELVTDASQMVDFSYPVEMPSHSHAASEDAMLAGAGATT